MATNLVNPVASFPDIPQIQENPLTPEFQAFILGAQAKLFPQRDASAQGCQLSQVLAVFRDGFVLPFSGLTMPVDPSNPVPLGKTYSLPVDVGAIVLSNQLAVIATLTAGGVPAASIWYPQGTKHICTGG